MNLFQVLLECGEEVSALVGGVKIIIGIVGWVVPAILIVYGVWDLFKAMTNGDEKEQKKAWQGFAKRVIFGIAIFLVPWLVRLAFAVLGNIFPSDDAEATSKNFFECYNSKTSSNGSGSSSTKTGRCEYIDEDTNQKKCTNVSSSTCTKLDGQFWSDRNC